MEKLLCLVLHIFGETVGRKLNYLIVARFLNEILEMNTNELKNSVDAAVPCNDNGAWTFSHDDVSGQEFDAQNNFGQAGGFVSNQIAMYPNRAVASSTCEFCDF